MINLLPPNKKEELFLEQVKKMVFVIGGLAVISLVCFILILLSIKFYILREVVHQKTILAEAGNANLFETKKIVEKYNEILPDIASFYKGKIYFSDALSDILKIKNSSGLYLSEISLDKGTGGAIKTVISGISDTRENLTILKNSVETDPKIKNSQFSPDSWIKEKNTNFYLTFEFSDENKDSK